MRIFLAYLSVILLWATTPLAIKLSVDGLGVLWSITLRMCIGTLCMGLLLWLFKKRLPFTRLACLTYAAISIQIYGAMLVVYWAAQFIPSGWISVISGLTPLVTAIFAAIWLNERSLTIGKILSYLIGIIGLLVMFGSALQFGSQAILGVIGVLVSISLQAVSAVSIKKIRSKLPALSQVTGGLLFSLPLYFATFGALDGQIPTQFSLISLLAVLYLGVIATPTGFMLYYYLLSQRPVTQVSLITLICPVLALWLGHRVSDEPITLKIIIGTGFILLALVTHNFFDKFFTRHSQRIHR
jgi:drug/metabolite transporter (DMT)-like permease